MWKWFFKKPDRAVPTEEEIAAIRRTFRRPAVILRSTLVTELPEGYVSCLGRVTWQLPGEEWPTDADGKRLEPLATLFVPDMPAVPAPLRKVALITIYAPFENDIDPAEDPMMGCVVRSYPSLEGLQACDAVSSEWKTCLLTPVSVENDMPTGVESMTPRQQTNGTDLRRNSGMNVTISKCAMRIMVPTDFPRFPLPIWRRPTCTPFLKPINSAATPPIAKRTPTWRPIIPSCCRLTLTRRPGLI